MSEQPRVGIATLPTGVPGLDAVLGSGLPEYSFNLIVGTPGAGKTTLAHQVMFALAAPSRPALYFTVLGEPPLKMLRYQQQFTFFDPARVGDDIQFVDLSDVVLERDLDQVLEQIVGRVAAANPGLVFVDSFQTVVRAAAGETGPQDLQRFVQRLAAHLTGWQATTFLIGEYAGDLLLGNPVFTVADGILHLTQIAERNSAVRKLQILKSRGQAPMPGLHTFRITQDGVQLFPRMDFPPEWSPPGPTGRHASGVAGLDDLLGGGIPAGDAVLVSGPSGTGKSIFAAQFIAAGARRGEPGVIAVFEERPAEYLRRADALGFDLAELVGRGLVEIIYIRPLDLSPDETLQAIREATARTGAQRVVVDSLSGFELALAPAFRADFRESLYRLVGALTGTGVTVVLTMEAAQGGDLQFSPFLVSFLADDLLLLRYVEIAGRLRKSIGVVKMRNSDHTKELHEYDITGQGLVIRESLRDYRGIGRGEAELRAEAVAPRFPGLTDQETTALLALIELGEASPTALARRVGLPEAALVPALARIVALGYAAAGAGEGEPRYRPMARAVY